MEHIKKRNKHRYFNTFPQEAAGGGYGYKKEEKPYAKPKKAYKKEYYSEGNS